MFIIYIFFLFIFLIILIKSNRIQLMERQQVQSANENSSTTQVITNEPQVTK